MKNLIILIVFPFLLISVPSSAEPICGDPFDRDHGPFDYITGDRKTLRMVESHHFDKDVERLIKGMTSTLGGDMSFVLRNFPNHHRALDAISRLSIRDKTTQPEGSRYSTLCWFDRAIRFRPDDATVRLIFSNHLLKINKQDMALEQLLTASDLEPNNPLIAYNLGLIYLKKRDYEKAVHYAREAYAKEFPLQGLKQQLIAAGKWQK